MFSLKDRKKYKILLAVIILLVFLNIISFSNFGQKVLVRIIGFSSYKIRGLSTDISNHNVSKADLLEKIAQLEEDFYKNEAELAKLYSLEDENEKLRQYLNFFNNNKFDYVVANVIWQENLLNFSNYNQNIIIDKGSKNGLRDGLIVVNESGIVVGKIIEVNDNISRVCLINNNFCKMAVSVNNSDKSIGLAEGDLGLSIKLNFVSQSEIINVGDRIITSGLEKDIPRGLAVGKINSVEQEVSDIWQNINAEALFNINNLNIVSVIIPK